MRLLFAVLLVASLAGCLSPVHLASCDGPQVVTLYLNDQRGLDVSLPSAGDSAAPDFSEGFVSDILSPWESGPMVDALLLTGDVEIEFWARNDGAVAPLGDPSNPGEGYYFFNQFGSNRSLDPGYAIEYRNSVQPPGTIEHYQETITLQPGGLTLEKDDQVKLLLTGLLVSGPNSGHRILVGEEYPSHVTFTAVCIDQPVWQKNADESRSVSLPGNKGLLTGIVPASEGVNQLTHPFTLQPETDRLTISIEQFGDLNPSKDDMDLEIRGPGGVIWEIGSPSNNENGVLWRSNLDAFMPPGEYAVVVNAYSGAAYDGMLTIAQHHAVGTA